MIAAAREPGSRAGGRAPRQGGQADPGAAGPGAGRTGAGFTSPPGQSRARLASLGLAGGTLARRRGGGRAKVGGFPAGGRGGRGSPGAGGGEAAGGDARAGEGASPWWLGLRPGRGAGGRPGAGAQLGRRGRQLCPEVGAGWAPGPARTWSQCPGSPRRGGPQTVPAPPPTRRFAPPRPARPSRRRDGRGEREEVAARPRGRGGVRDAGGGSQGSRRLGSQHPAGAEGRTRPVTRSREGLAGSLSWGRLVREEGRGGRGRSFSLPSLYFLQQDVGRQLTSWGLPAPPLARAEWGRGRLRGGGDPKGVSSATRRRKGKVIVKLETH